MKISVYELRNTGNRYRNIRANKLETGKVNPNKQGINTGIKYEAK